MRLKGVPFLVIGALVVSACSQASPSGGGTAVKIGVELPLSGGELPNGDPTLKGVQLAIDQNPVAGFTVTVNKQDDAVNGVHDPQQGARNIQTLVNDSSVFAVVGPFNSNVAQAEIPVSNSAGLVQCSPANTNPTLTKGASATALRKTHPDKIAYVRVATTDDIQGQAGADIAYNVAKAKTAYVVDDTETYGKGLADVFADSFTKLGGTVVAHDGAPANVRGDFTALLTTAKAKNPQFVYFGGVTATGGGLLRKQMVQLGMGNIPFGGGDGISDGSAATAKSFLNLATPDGDTNSYMTVAAIHEIPNAGKFAADYKAKYGTEPGAYSASGYACAQIFLQALKSVGKADREAIRAYVTNTANKFDTALGTVSFDANGDTTQHIISYYKFDPTTKDWAFFEQKDFTSGQVVMASSAPGGGGASPAPSASGS